MKAIKVDGKIKTFTTLPKNWDDGKNFYLNIKEDDLERLGFYDVEVENVNPLIEKHSPLYFDEKSKVFRRDIIKIKFPESLDFLKEQKISKLEKNLNILLKETDRYILDKVEIGTEIPNNIIEQRKELRNKALELEVEINDLTTKEEVILFSLRSFEIDN
jgi:hypothetical protein